MDRNHNTPALPTAAGATGSQSTKSEHITEALRRLNLEVSALSRFRDLVVGCQPRPEEVDVGYDYDCVAHMLEATPAAIHDLSERIYDLVRDLRGAIIETNS